MIREIIEGLPDGWIRDLISVNPKWNWTDSMILQYPGLILPSLTESEIVTRGKSMMQELAYGVSISTAGTILILASHLTSPSQAGYRVFPPGEIPSHPDDVEHSTLGSEVNVPRRGFYGNYDTIPTTTFARGVCYFAASLLRLFAKPAQNYLRDYSSHVKDDYSKFYRDVFPFTDYSPSRESMEKVHLLFTNQRVLKGTLGKLLYLFKTRHSRDRAFLSALFEQHVAMSGMHSVDLFMKICNRVNVKPQVLAELCKGGGTEEELETILKVTSILMAGSDDPRSEYYRQTWRYARVFDHNYFVKVQTKHCLQLTCLLGRLAQRLGIPGSGNIFQLFQLQDMSAEIRVLQIGGR